MKVLGVDIGGTNTEIAVVDSKLGILTANSFKTKSNDSFNGFINTLTEEISKLNNSYDIASIGIGAPNFDSHSQTFCPVNFPWSDLKPFNLKTHIESILNVETHLINDANASALAENRYGMEINSKILCLLQLDRPRWRIIINNQLFEGAFGYAGEFGHTKIDGIERQCNCGGIGCLETIVSANGIKKSYAVNMSEIKSSSPNHIPSVSYFSKSSKW